MNTLLRYLPAMIHLLASLVVGAVALWLFMNSAPGDQDSVGANLLPAVLGLISLVFLWLFARKFGAASTAKAATQTLQPSLSGEEQPTALSAVAPSQARITQAKHFLDTLEQSGILLPGEIGLEALLEAGDWGADSVASDDLIAFLATTPAARTGDGLANAVLLRIQTERTEQDALSLAQKLSAMSGLELNDLTIKIRAEAGEHHGINALLHFVHDGTRADMPFLLPGKTPPIEMIEQLIHFLDSRMENRQFVIGGSDEVLLLSLISPEALEAANTKLGGEVFSKVS